MSAGFVYVLANPSLRDKDGALIFKIGGTARTPLRRAAELSASSSIPARFSVAFEARCQDWKAVECAVHLSLLRFRRRGEFFCAPLETIADAIRHALTHLESVTETVKQSASFDPTSPPAVPSFIDLTFGTATVARLYCPGDMVSFSSRYGTIDFDLPPVPRRLRADRARRVRDYIQRSMAERLFREVSPVLEPDVVLRPADGGTNLLTINAEPAFRIAVSEKTRWWSRRRWVSATAQHARFCKDRLPLEFLRTGLAGEREVVLHEVMDAALRAYVQHAIEGLESAPPSLRRL